MTKREKFVRREFKVFSANLGMYFPELADAFICPLCFEAFHGVEAHWTKLSQAHILPEFLGGREATLACERCNNRIGYSIEAEEKKRQQDHLQWTGQEGDGRRVRLGLKNNAREVAGMNAFLSVNPTQNTPALNFRLREGQCDPQQSEESDRIFRESLDKQSGEVTVRVSYRSSYDSRRADLTYLSVTYLRLFHEMGYEWVFSPVGQLVREQLVQPEKKLFPPHKCGMSAGFREGVALAICFAETDARGIYVPIPPSRLFDQWSAIWFPMLDEPYPAQAPPSIEGQTHPVTTYRSSHALIDQPDMRLFWHHQMYPDRRYSWSAQMDVSSVASPEESQSVTLQSSE